MADAAKPARPKATASRRTRKKPAAPETLTSFSPTSGRVLGEVSANSPGEVADIVAQARKVAPEWAAIPPEGRARVLRQIRYRIYERMDEIIDTVSAENGKPRAEALASDIMPTVLCCLTLERTVAKALRPKRMGRIAGALTIGAASHVEWRPFGVVGCISPWNYPFWLAFQAMLPALFAGNTVVIKPSEVTPGVGERIREVLDPLPPGVATVIQGGGTVGAALVDAPCDKIVFIGSPGTGRKIAAAAAQHLTPVVMELGGQDPAIVCADADLDIATSGVLWGSFLNAGQTCCSIERAYVVESVADEFERRLLEKLAKLRQGEGDDADVGSLTFKHQLEVVQRHVEDAVSRGATVLAGGPDAGRRNEEGSLWYAPTVLAGVSEEMDVLKEETFGPILPVIRVRDEDEAVRRANEDGFNLTSSIWTTDARKARRLASQIRAGNVSINDHAAMANAWWAPWGGVGESGYGRLNGELGLKEMCYPVHVSRAMLPKMKRLWWFPYDEATTTTLREATALLAAPGVGPKAAAARSLLGAVGRSIRSKL